MEYFFKALTKVNIGIYLEKMYMHLDVKTTFY